MAPHRSMTGADTDPLADWSDRTSLLDGNGRTMLVFTMSQSTRSGLPWADDAWRPPAAAVAATTAAVLPALAGYTVSTSDVELAAALVAAGARQLRHAHVMSHPLTTVTQASPPAEELVVRALTAAQVDRHVERLAEIYLRAYPVGRPDHMHSDTAAAVGELRAISRGEILGPYLTQSTVAVMGGQIVGACLVVGREGAPPDGGPWLVDVFRDPGCTGRGVGRALVVATLKDARSAGLPGLSLAVSRANARALDVYSALGFGGARESWTLVLPG